LYFGFSFGQGRKPAKKEKKKKIKEEDVPLSGKLKSLFKKERKEKEKRNRPFTVVRYPVLCLKKRNSNKISRPKNKFSKSRETQKTEQAQELKPRIRMTIEKEKTRCNLF